MRTTLATSLSEDNHRRILEFLDQANAEAGLVFDPQALNLLVEEGGVLVAGLVGSTNWGWLHVKLLSVKPEFRRRGLGKHLIETAEREARLRGCMHSHLDTFSFQALPFYQRLGYEVFGVLDDFPPGHKRYFLRKDL